jgi:hypothetical protein
MADSAVQSAQVFDREIEKLDGREGAVRTVERPAIPFGRVQQIVRDLLGADVDLRNIRGLTVHREAVVVEVLAVNQAGRRFMIGGEIAIDRIHFPVESSG